MCRLEHCVPFSIEVEQQEGPITYARLAGELDLAVVDRFKVAMGDLIARAQGGTLMVDLRGLSFMDSTGIRLMLQLDAESRNDGFELAVINGTGLVHRALRETGVDRILPMRDSL
jgi:anti-sigma B factor antagonist